MSEKDVGYTIGLVFAVIVMGQLVRDVFEAFGWKIWITNSFKKCKSC